MDAHRHRVLITVYSANPLAQSEPLNGFKYVRELHKIADVQIIAHMRDRAMADCECGRNVHFAGSARLAGVLRSVSRPLFKESWHLINSVDFLDYIAFELDALRIGAALHKQYRFDLVHRITPTTVRFPGLIWRLGVPTVSGPHNGGMAWPAGFRHLAGIEGTADSLRGVGDSLHRFVGDFERYAKIIVANEACRAVVPARFRGKVTIEPENGVDGVGEQSPHAGDATRLLYVGRLVTIKCVDAAISAVGRLPRGVRLTIVGDGPERAKLEALAARLGVRERVRFAGWVPHAAVADFCRDAGVFVFPSVRESGGGALLEAMAAGLPPIVAGWGGPLQYVSPDAGVVLSVESPRRMEDDLVAAVERMLAAPASAAALGRRAQDKVRREFLWPAKARRIVEVYDEVLRAVRSG